MVARRQATRLHERQERQAGRDIRGDIDGTGLKRLTPWSLDAGNPDWSPDGREILFNPYWDPHPGKFSNVYSMRPDGSHPTRLTHARPGVQSFAPAWSPDGTEDRLRPLHTHRQEERPHRSFHDERDGSRPRRLTNMPGRSRPTRTGARHHKRVVQR